jgi:hypothetical protein
MGRVHCSRLRAMEEDQAEGAGAEDCEANARYQQFDSPYASSGLGGLLLGGRWCTALGMSGGDDGTGREGGRVRVDDSEGRTEGGRVRQEAPHSRDGLLSKRRRPRFMPASSRIPIKSPVEPFPTALPLRSSL